MNQSSIQQQEQFHNLKSKIT